MAHLVRASTPSTSGDEEEGQVTSNLEVHGETEIVQESVISKDLATEQFEAIVPNVTKNTLDKESVKDRTSMETLRRQPSSMTKAQIARTIKQAASDSHVGDEGSLELNEMLLYQAVCAAGEWAYGVVATEVWVLNSLTGCLEQPAGGYWRDPVFPPSTALNRIEDCTLDDYVPPKALAPGESLAGALWSEAGSSMFAAWKSHRGLDVNEMPTSHVVWRSVNALCEDPDQPPSERLKLLGQAGFGLAAGVTFHIKDTKGIVVYMARETADLHQLQSRENELYLASAADLIGAEVALSAKRATAIRNRVQRRREMLTRARHKLRVAMALSSTFLKADQSSTVAPPPPPPPAPSCMDKFKDKIRVESQKAIQFANKQVTKAQGTNMVPPPKGNWQQFLICFVGAFLPLLILDRLNAWIKLVSNGEKSILLAPVAAFICMQYGLTGAPASQPRNALFGQVISMGIPLLCKYIPVVGDYGVWLLPAFSISLTVAVMVAAGTIHPPGAASAFLVAFGNFNWSHLGLILVAYVICIMMSCLINNWFDQRQYPIYWGLTYGTSLYDVKFHNFFNSKTKKTLENQGTSLDSTLDSEATTIP